MASKRPARFFAKTENGHGVLMIYDEIGSSMWTEGVTPKSITASLDALAAEGAKDLHIYINSPGGDVFDGNAIFNALNRWDRGQKIVHIDGLAASMASVIAMVGDRREIAANGLVMIHEPWGVVVGNAEEMISRAALLEKLGENILDTYEKRTGQKRDELKQMMADETWMSAEEALAHGFVDSIVETDERVAEEDDELGGWSMLDKFRRTPANAARLLARASVARANPAASSRVPPPQAAIPEEKAMSEKTDATPVPAPAAASVTLTAEQFNALINRQPTVTAPVAVAAPGPVADVLDDATRAPAIAKFAMPRALKGREEMSDASAPNAKIRAALPLARVACATVVANDRRMPLADAAAMIGFDRTADMIARNAAMSVGDADAGGSLAHTVQMGFIDALLDMPGITNLIPAGNIYRSDKPSIQLDVLTAGVSGGWVQENPTTGNPEALTTGSKVLTAKKQRIEVLISRDLLRSVSNIDQIVLNKMLLRAKQLDDLAFVEGLGSTNQPKGLEVINANGAAQSGTDYEAAYSDLTDVLKRMALDKVPLEAGRAWIVPEQAKWGLAKMLMPGGNNFGFKDELMAGKLLSYPAAFSTLIGTDKVYAFAPGEVLFFEQLAMLIENDNTYISAAGTTVSASGSDQTVIRLWRKIDCDLAHNDSMGLVNTVTWGA